MQQKLQRFKIHYLPHDAFYSEKAASMSLLALDANQAAERFSMFSTDRILLVEKIQWLARFRWLPTPFYLDSKGELTPYLEFAHLFDAQRLTSSQKTYVTEQDLEWVSPHQLTLAGEFEIGQAVAAYLPGYDQGLIFGAIKGCQINEEGARVFLLENHLGETILAKRDCLLPCPRSDLERVNKRASTQSVAARLNRKASGF